MNLIVDSGNTKVKLAVFKGGKIIFIADCSLEDVAKKVKDIYKEYPQIKRSIVSAVRNLDTKAISLMSIFSQVHHLSHTSKLPFKNSYVTPQTLGADRIALAAAAFYDNINGNTLVIDAGTCVTYDMINDYGEYLGGAISPGIQMRYRAMHSQTAKLPMLGTSDVTDFIGNTTETSMHSGVFNGICNEIDGTISQYKLRFKDLTVILTGGDAQFLSKRLKNTIFANSNFLLQGLNYLLEYNKH